MMIRVLICTIFVSIIVAAPRNTYKGWKLYRCWPPTEDLVEAIALLYENTENFDFWTPIRGPNEPVDIAVREIAHPSFENLLEKLNITNEVQIEYVDKALNREIKEMKAAPNPEKGNINFLKYHRYNVIMDYLDNLSKKYKNLVKVESIGKSVEDRNVKVIKISGSNNKKKPAIVIEAGLAPREWIGPAQALYIVQQLVENVNNKEMVENVDWYIIPLINPDGYEYTHTTERLWKKNRSKNGIHYGVNLNRNFDIDFGKQLSSSSEEAWNFHGPRAFSEPETKALKKFIEDNALQIKLYLSLHSLGPNILYPYGFSETPPKNVESLKTVTEKVSEILQANDIPYNVKSSSSKHHMFSGSSVDWALEKAKIPYVYAIELTSPGYLGFDFPVHRLQQVVKEFMVALNVFHDFVRNEFGTSPPMQDKKDEL